MKIVTLILLILVVSCTSPERKIKDSFNFQRGNLKVKKVQIYDTLYANKLFEELDFFQNRINILEKSIKNMGNYRDSVFRLHYPNPKQDSLIRIGYEQKGRYAKELNYISFRQNIIESISFEMNDTIAGYYGKIITKIDTLDFIVSPTFQIICPKYMYEN